MSFNYLIKKEKQADLIPTLRLSECLAKTYRDEKGNTLGGRDVLTHCLIVGYVARSLISRLPDWVQNDLFPKGSELVAAAHDVGKVCPTFQKKIHEAITPTSLPPSLANVYPHNEERWGGHAGVSQLSTLSCLTSSSIPYILGQHHGYSPKLEGYKAHDEVFGGKAWQSRREELLHDLQRTLNCDWPNIINSHQSTALAGLTTVSDWIGSGPLFNNPSDENWLNDIEKSLDEAGFISPELQHKLTFEQIFDNKPRLAQSRLIEACQEPGVYVLEAPMGIGKTEAALYAAYKMMTSGKATGIYFALPTQLTSDKMHDRVEAFLRRIVTPTSYNKNAMLIHGNARLKATVMGEDGQPSGSWFQAKKRAILAPFGVGTIDQALMSVMNIKHGFVRAFGLIGKVVILDEVHSYDSYTGTILDNLIETLRHLKCTVILLSATLTLERRKFLLNLQITPKSKEYPLITSLNASGLCEIGIEPSKDVNVRIEFRHDYEAIDECLSRAANGQQVLWIENTVVDAQKQYKKLAARASELQVECGLLHSRFIKVDRNKIEEKWVGIYGKEGGAEREKSGRILVGTQILEQSLDIDADFLITRICPTDMLLQRLGRLWRHNETKRPSKAAREAWILSPSLETALCKPKTAFGSYSKVYALYILMRSLEVFSPLKQVTIPSQIRELIEATYEKRTELEPVWQELFQELELDRKKLNAMARSGLSQDGKTLPENASTRFCEQDTVEVLLLKELQIQNDMVQITFLHGDKILFPKRVSRKNSKEHKELSLTLMENTVRVAVHLAPSPTLKVQLECLQDYIYLGNAEESLLRVAKVTESNQLVSLDGSQIHDSLLLKYNSTLGYFDAK